MALDESLYDVLIGDEEGRVCRDIPEELCDEQPRNFLVHAASLALTKSGDGLADAKLVLAWLLGALGAPAAAVGMLVPVRESLSLLPQLVIAGFIRGLEVRKWVWVLGSAVQGLAVLAIGWVALTMDGAAAGWTIVGLLAVFALFRSVASISHKDVLGKTVSKSTRGTAKGAASSISAVTVLGFGALLAFGVIPLNVDTVAVALFVAGALWLTAALLFSTVREEPGATAGGGNALTVAVQQLGLLREDPQLVRFILTRGLLIATALSPPFLLALAGEEGQDALDTLGPFVIASSLAALLGGYTWGRFADVSSRRVLMAAAVLGGVANAAALGVVAAFRGTDALTLLMAGVLFVLMLAHQGVRLGRSTHVVDMADEDTRAAYTALSNTAIGLLLLGGGAFGEEVVLMCFIAMCAVAFFMASTLREVQR